MALDLASKAWNHTNLHILACPHHGLGLGRFLRRISAA